MIHKHIGSYFRDLYSNYKYPCITYAILLVVSLVLYPQQFLHSFSRFGLLSVVNAALTEPVIYGPLLIGIAFFIINFIWNKKFLLKHRFLDIAAILIFSLISSGLINLIYGIAQPDAIAYWSNAFMSADHILFGTYPAFWMFQHTSNFFAWLEITIYGLMPTFITAWVLFLFIYRGGTHLKSFLNMLYFTVGICLPLWLMFQSIGPGQMFIANLLHVPISPTIMETLKIGPPSKFVDDTVLYYVKFWMDPTGKAYAISTFPSMHTVWGFILFYSVFEIFRKKKYGWIAYSIFFIIAVINMLGAIFVLQHYAVDILSGIVIAICISKIPYKRKSIETIEAK